MTWPRTPPGDDEAVRIEHLLAEPRIAKDNWVPSGRSERYGHAEMIVDAPVSVVRKYVSDYAHYKDLAPGKFKHVHAVARTRDSVDLYFQVPILHGMVNLWYVTRFAPALRLAADREIVEGTFVKGNVKDVHIVFTTRAVNDRQSFLSCDLLLVLSMPAPQSAVDEELRDAAGYAVRALNERSIGMIAPASASIP